MITVRQRAAEVERGERFEFGENWTTFLRTLNNDSIAMAEQSLRQMLGREYLKGFLFIHIGCGSGLSSLAARRLGARVLSYNFNPQSSNCARELRGCYFPDDPQWSGTEGSVLDEEFIRELGQFDIVYSWCVVHNTGQMWRALDLVTNLLKPEGQLIILIYNDQGGKLRRWIVFKKIYGSGISGRVLKKLVFVRYFVLRSLAIELLKLTDPTKAYRKNYNQRGMSCVHDWYHWLGGYTFDVTKPEQIFDFDRHRGFNTQRMTNCAGGLGCNQFVFSPGTGGVN